ncbi:hypothetical protein B0H15DRAFT_1001512 [Mycena belliarum]|uniref:Uncharacterized protein n=1 Tax=Mycena belliarum TaxID=1033014 RepID=A0AAD6TWU2_9AGAR|nr:hypothetical protein B0H15DRAFT_1001512 [Mycena belliae]
MQHRDGARRGAAPRPRSADAARAGREAEGLRRVDLLLRPFRPRPLSLPCSSAPLPIPRIPSTPLLPSSRYAHPPIPRNPTPVPPTRPFTLWPLRRCVHIRRCGDVIDSLARFGRRRGMDGRVARLQRAPLIPVTCHFLVLYDTRSSYPSRRGHSSAPPLRLYYVPLSSSVTVRPPRFPSFCVPWPIRLPSRSPVLPPPSALSLRMLLSLRTYVCFPFPPALLPSSPLHASRLLYPHTNPLPTQEVNEWRLRARVPPSTPPPRSDADHHGQHGYDRFAEDERAILSPISPMSPAGMIGMGVGMHGSIDFGAMDLGTHPGMGDMGMDLGGMGMGVGMGIGGGGGWARASPAHPVGSGWV